MPVAILYLGVLLTILIGIHILILAIARTSLQSAADSAVAAASIAASSDRQDAGALAAQLAIVAARGSLVETRAPQIIVEEDRGIVRALVFAGTLSPVFGGIEMSALACGPLENVNYVDLVGTDPWEC